MLSTFELDLSNINNTDSFTYADSASRYQIQLPLALSWYTQSGVVANDLYTDDDTRFVTYASGLNETIFTSRIKDRFGGVSIEVIEGSFSAYLQAYDESIWDPNPPAIAGPYTISGDTSGDVLFISTFYEDSPESPQLITFSGAGSYKIVFPKPVVSRSFKLIHSGSSPYKISRIIPRRAVQSFDLEVNAIKAYHVSASLIETIALEVSDSIVIGPDLIGDKTISGDKIIDGTVSGVIITPGTITGNLIQAGTISGVLITAGSITTDKLNVVQLDALAANTGSLFVNSGITLGDQGYIWTGASISGEVLITKSGIIVDNAFAPGTEIFSIGGGSRFIFDYVPRARIRYFPALYSFTDSINYTLTPYSGSEFYFDVSASQVGKIGTTSNTFNGYASRIQTGYVPTATGLRNDYAESEISVIASGQAYLTLSASDVDESVGSSIIMTAGGNGFSYLGGSPGTRVSINSRELRVRTSFVNIKDNLTVYKDVSQTGPFIESFSPILEVNETNFRYVDPKDSYVSSPAVDLFVVNNSGSASLRNNLTVSGAVYGISGLSTQYELSSNGIFFRDSADNSTVFEASSNGVFVKSTTGNRIVEIATDTGNLDLLGGDFFVYNSTETAIVAGITKTGSAEFTSVASTGNISTNGVVIATNGIRVEDSNNYARVAASQSTLSTRSSANALTFTVDTATGNTRAYGDFRVDANFTQFNYGSMTKNTAQTVNAGVTAKITFQVAGANGVLDDLTNNQINIVDGGLYLIVAGVVSTTAGLTWQVVSGGAFNSGVLLNGVTQADGRAYSSKMLYLNPGELELWLSNTGGTNAAISIGNNGAVLSVTKVG